MSHNTCNHCLQRLARPEQAPALLALADAHHLVLPATHDGVIVALAELGHEGLTAGLGLRQLLPERRLKLQAVSHHVSQQPC